MWIGRTLVIAGATLGSLCLSLVLFFISGPSYPVTGFGSSPEASSSLSSQAGSTQLDQQSSVISSNTAASGRCRISNKFPDNVRQWCDLITREAEAQGLSPDLIAALIWQESGGDPQAYSRSGAVGLMQVMPNDGIAASFMCKNGPCFTNRPSTSDLKDPSFNVTYGTQLLARLLNRTGDLREALRSYGPMDVGYHYADTVLKLAQQYGQ